MTRFVKFSVGILLTVVLLAGLTVAGLAIFVNPNNIKPYLAKVVEEKTGHELAIGGKLKWSIYPQLGISAEKVLIKNKPNFPEENLLSADQLTVSVQLLPLFSKQLKIDQILISDAELNLTKNRASNSNWEVKTNQKTKKKSSADNNTDASKFGVDISKISVNNTTINYHDMSNNSKSTITGFNFSTKNIQPNKPFKISADFAINDTQYIFEGMIQFHSDEQLLLVQDYQFKIKGDKEGVLEGSAKLNLESERLDMEPLHFQIADLDAHGSLNGENVLSKPDIKGQFETNNFSPKNLSSALGNPIRTKDSDALSSAILKTDIAADANSIRFENIQASLDKTKLKGFVKINIKNNTLNFRIDADQIAIDRYELEKNGKSKKTTHNMRHPERKSRFKANGKIRLDSIYARKARLDNLKSDLTYQNNILRFTNLTANIFEGTTSGSVTINTKGKTPIVQLNQKLNNISVATAQNAILGNTKVTGTANARINLSFQGDISGLNGDINLISRNGVIKGIDVDYQLQRAAFIIQKLTEKNLKDTGETPYSVFTATINIKNGIAKNPSMVIESPSMKVKAKGTTNLASQELDYRLGARSKRSIDIKTEYVNMDISDYDIPITVTGTVNDPKVSLDVVQIAKIAAKKQIMKTIEKTAEQPISETIDAIKKVLPF